MKILPINNINNAVAKRSLGTVSRISYSPVFCSEYSFAKIPNYASAMLYIEQMDKLKEETKTYPQDIEYRKSLLINAGLNPENQHKIRSIIGTQELTAIMQEFNDNEMLYSSGENFQNVNSYNMRANLHIHTVNSDGLLSTQELLDSAAEYANKAAQNNPNAKKYPFIIAITDHDTTEATQEAIKIISENPQKYKNLRVVLGAEITTFNNIGIGLVDKPTNTHVLLYGIDPNEKTFKSFIDGIKSKKLNIEKMMVKTANQVYKEKYGIDNFFNLSQAKLQYNQLNKDIVGIYNNLDMYFQNKLAIQNIIMKNETITKALQEHNIPTDTDLFMEKMRDFRYIIDRRNNMVIPTEKCISEFISAATGIEEAKVAEIIINGLKEEKVADTNQAIKQNIEQYKVTFTPKYDYMPTFETVYEGTKGQKQIIMGIAHPIDTTKPVKRTEDKYKFLEDLYSKFINGCKDKAKFSEVYYQSYKPGRKQFKENPTTQKFMNEISKLYKLFKTGSQDTHSRNIFRR